MAWRAATFTIKPAFVEALTDALLEVGAVSVDVTDAYIGTPREHALFNEPGEPAAVSASEWELAKFNVLFPIEEDINAGIEAAFDALELPAPQDIFIEDIADQDWVRATQSQFQPVQVSERLWVVPTWHTAPDANAINLIIDPGLAFGTGTHPTTRLCLEWLDKNLQGGETVLDYGCGSGILAIAAMKLGAASAVGVDIDENAVVAAQHNAMQNQANVTFFAATENAGIAKADIVLANILANPLKMLAPLLANHTRVGGHIVLSGILDHQVDEVRAVYAEWFRMKPALQSEGWTLLTGVREGVKA